jgi:hypothetical protein
VFDGAVSCVCPPGRTLLAGRCVRGSDAVCAAAGPTPLPSQRRRHGVAGPGGNGTVAAVWDGRGCACPAGFAAGLGGRGCVAGSTELCRRAVGPGRVWSAADGECRCGPGLAELGPGGGCVPATRETCEWALGPRGRPDPAARGGCGCPPGHTADVNGTCEPGSDALCRARGGPHARFDGVAHCTCGDGTQPDPTGYCTPLPPGAPAPGPLGGAGAGEVTVGRLAGLRRAWDAADADGDGVLAGDEMGRWGGDADGMRDSDRVRLGGGGGGLGGKLGGAPGMHGSIERNGARMG